MLLAQQMNDPWLISKRWWRRLAKGLAVFTLVIVAVGLVRGLVTGQWLPFGQSLLVLCFAWAYPTVVRLMGSLQLAIWGFTARVWLEATLHDPFVEKCQIWLGECYRSFFDIAGFAGATGSALVALVIAGFGVTF